MKKFLLVIVLVLLCLSVASAQAQDWYCPNCGAPNADDAESCVQCGNKNITWICPACGNYNDSPYCIECGLQKPLKRDDFVGNWKFELGEFDVFLTLREDGTYILTYGNGGMQMGTYSFSEDYLTLISEELIQTFEYKVSRNYMTLETLGPGLLTEERPGFTMMNKGQAMMDTMADGTLVTVSICDPREAEAFDIVAVRYPNETGIYLKRLIGLPGDVVELRNGELYINGEKWNEPYVAEAYMTGEANTFGPYTVPDGHIFVLGDHRNESEDSRQIGPIPYSMLLGVVEKK